LGSYFRPPFPLFSFLEKEKELHSGRAARHSRFQEIKTIKTGKINEDE